MAKSNYHNREELLFYDWTHTAELPSKEAFGWRNLPILIGTPGTDFFDQPLRWAAEDLQHNEGTPNLRSGREQETMLFATLASSSDSPSPWQQFTANRIACSRHGIAAPTA